MAARARCVAAQQYSIEQEARQVNALYAELQG
jgi:hypothetical protein